MVSNSYSDLKKVTQGHVWFLLVFHCNCLSCIVSEILTFISQNFKRSYDPEYTPKLQNLLLPLDAMLADVYVVVRPSVRHQPVLCKTAKHRITQTTLHDSAGTLAFDAKNIGEFRPGSPPTATPNAGGISKHRRFSTNDSLYLENGARLTHNFYSSWIKSRIHSIELWHCRWPPVTHNRPRLSHFSTVCTACHTFVAGAARDFKFSV